nr:hypothetical protein [Methanosarcina barkeri]
MGVAVKTVRKIIKWKKIPENVEIAVLGGVGFNSYQEFESRLVSTPYGEVTVYLTTVRGKKSCSNPQACRRKPYSSSQD